MLEILYVSTAYADWWFCVRNSIGKRILDCVRKKINDFKSLVFVKWFEVEFYTNTFILQKQHYFWLEWSMVIRNCVFIRSQHVA